MASILKTPCGKDIIIDDEDYEKVASKRWSVRIRNGLVSYVRNRHVGMLHRYVLGLSEDDDLVDHINRNPLDNRKLNLRVTNKAENAVNSEKKSGTYSSKYKGVSLDRTRNLYRTRVNDLEFGSFAKEIDAANAYNFYVRYLYEMPYLNQVPYSEWYRNKAVRGNSFYKGVSKSRQRWTSSVWYKGKHHYIGIYDSELEAAISYNRKAIELGLSINRLNLINIDGDVLVNKNLECI